MKRSCGSFGDDVLILILNTSKMLCIIKLIGVLLINGTAMGR